MSEDDPRKSEQDEIENQAANVPDEQSNLSTDMEDEDEQTGPLTPSEFREALQKVDDLGLAWTADSIPRLKTKEAYSSEVLFSKEYRALRYTYPTLPHELSAAVFYELTGSASLKPLLGSEEEAAEKVATARDLVITNDYRSEFFFLRATKVPYFSNIDWEVVVKTFEKNVEGVPGIAYALLSLHFQDPRAFGEEGEKHHMTVAADERLVNRIIDSLVEVKSALEQAQGAGGSVNWSSERKGESDD